MPNNNDTPAPPSITLPLSAFLDYVFTYFHTVPIKEEHGTLIALLDKNEYQCHVEFPGPDNTLSTPQLWRKKEWVGHIEKWRIDKKHSAIRRHEANVFHENRQRIARHLSNMFGMDSKDCVDMADRMLRKNPDMAKAIGAKVEGAMTYEELQKKGIV